MKIETNICDVSPVHNSIAYPSIESQALNLFTGHCGVLPGDFSVSYKMVSEQYVFVLNGIDCGVEVGKKGVKISVMPRY